MFVPCLVILRSLIFNCSSNVFLKIGELNVPSFFPYFIYSSTIILVLVSSSYFILTVTMCEASCVGYTPCARNSRSLEFIVNSPLYFGLLQRLQTALSLVYNINYFAYFSSYLFQSGEYNEIIS